MRRLGILLLAGGIIAALILHQFQDEIAEPLIQPLRQWGYDGDFVLVALIIAVVGLAFFVWEERHR